MADPDPAAPPAPPPAATWYSTLDAETQAYVTSKGLADKDPATAFAEAAKSHRAAEQYIGAPAEQLIRLPKADDTNPDAWKPVWEKLGRPAAATGYDLTGVKHGDGRELEQAFADAFRQAAFDQNLPAPAAGKIAEAFVRYQDGQATAAAADATAKLEAARAELRASWGQNFDANLFIARQAALKLGLTPDQVAGMENALGYKELMTAFNTIGKKIGEDAYVASPGATGDGTVTREQAEVRIKEMKEDDAFQKRLLAGGAAEAREFRAMHEIVDAANKRAAA